MINQDRKILGDFSVNFESISLNFNLLHVKWSNFYNTARPLNNYFEIFRPLQYLKEIGLESMGKSPKFLDPGPG